MMQNHDFFSLLNIVHVNDLDDKTKRTSFRSISKIMRKFGTVHWPKKLEMIGTNLKAFSGNVLTEDRNVIDLSILQIARNSSESVVDF